MAQLRITCELGIGLRGGFKKHLERFCWVHELELDIRESKGWLSSFFVVDVKGPDDKLLALKAWVEAAQKQFSSESKDNSE